MRIGQAASLFFFDVLHEEAAHEIGQVGAGGFDLILEAKIDQRLIELASRLVALFAVTRHGAADDFLEVRGQRPGSIEVFGDVIIADAEHDVQIALTGKEAPHAQRLKEHNTRRKDITSSVDTLTHDLLWGHIADLALEGARLGQGAFNGGFGDAKVADFDISGVADEDIGWAHIAVDDVEIFAIWIFGAVGKVEALEHLHGDKQHDMKRQFNLQIGATGEDVEQVLAVDELHGDVILFFDLAEVEDLYDVGVIEAHGNFGFVDEHINELFIIDELGQDELDGKLFLEARSTEGLGTQDFSHPADADFVEQDVTTERGTFSSQIDH